jgi:predicted trehalose synthase
MVGLDVEARWFAGKGRAVRSVDVVDQVGGLALADVGYTDDGAGERYLLLDEDPAAWRPLLDALGAGPLTSRAGGRLELRPGPALAELGAGPGGATVPATDQTNTLAVLGGRLLVKAYRRLEAGVHPEAEVLAALAGTAAPVPAFGGSVHHVAPDGADTTVAVLQEFVAGAEAGWEAPIEAVAALLRDGGDMAAAVEPYRAAGRAAAELHAALAGTLGVTPGTPADLAAWRADAEAALAEAAAGDAEVAAAADAVRAELAVLATLTPPALTRTHGDLHYAQLLRAPGRLAIVDFEGDPTRPLAARRSPDTPLRDLACLTRSIDHIGSAASRRCGWAPPDAWIAAAARAALDGYAERAPVPIDHRLFRALEVAKECGEHVYAQRVLPEWAYTPRLALRRLLGEATA